jgi:bifunctional DNA-binding transcriptional regulator/antitoxin component of YhaV-PrlF toxin-antitoxin module
MSNAREYVTVVSVDAAGRVVVPVPFDPDEVWGPKPRHHIAGTVDGMRVRGEVEGVGDGRAFTLGPAWRRDCGVEPGRRVTVVIDAEGPQRSDLAPDVAEALDASPVAGAFFDGLAQFYRKGYLRWVDATKRRPEVRAARIAEMVELLEAGHKERPRT